MNSKQLLGSNTAKDGFQNENNIVKKFNNYKTDIEAKKWLTIMGYDSQKITSLEAFQIPPSISKQKAIEYGSTEENFDETIKYKKSDIQIRLKIVINELHLVQNLSLKKANAGAGSNQIDKRSVRTYQNMWGFNNAIANTLEKFTGQTPPSLPKSKLKKSKRMYFTEMLDESTPVINFFKENKVLIFNDLIRGRGALSVDWFLVTRKHKNNGNTDWVLKDINFVCNFYSQGSIEITKRGGLKIGRITAQRKGGTPDPTSLKFKLNPLKLFDI